MTTSRLYTGSARALDGIPVVPTTAARNARYPSPPENFRVENTETGRVERYVSGAWTPDWPVGTAGAKWFNVLDYGATGDGTTNDSPYIQAAVDAAEVAGGVVYFPVLTRSGAAAVYGIGTMITVSSQYPVTLASDMVPDQLVDGDHSSYLKPLTGVTPFMVKYVTPTANRYDAGGGILRGLVFLDDASRSVSVGGFYGRDFMNGKLIDCHFLRLKGTAVKLDGAVQGSMARCAVRYCGDTGAYAVWAGNTDSSTYTVQAFHFVDCRFEVCYSADYVYMPNQTNQGSNKILGCAFESDTAVSATQQVYINSDQFKNEIANCTFNRNNAQHVLIDTNGTDTIYADNIHDGDSTAGTIRLRFVAQRVMISNVKSRAAVSQTGTEVSVEGALSQINGLSITTGGKLVVSGATCSIANVFQYQCKATSGHAIEVTGAGCSLGGFIDIHTTATGVYGLTVPTTAIGMTASIRLQNIEGTSPTVLKDDWYADSNVGDADVTLYALRNAPVQRYATALTANRTVTLSTTGAYHGAHFRVVRTGLGAFTLDVGGLKTIGSATAAFVDVIYNGSAWVLAGYGTL